MDRDILLKDQYQNTGNLTARIDLHLLFSVNKYGWFRWVFDRLAMPPAARILEIACGRDLYHNLTASPRAGTSL
jgi:hypothetical protein